MTELNLQNSLIFKGVDEQYIEEFLLDCETITLAKGEFLFHQNDLGDTMYLVESGQIQIIVNNKTIGICERGVLIGELCVFGQQKRSASIVAFEDSKLIVIKGEDFRTRIFAKDLDALLICYNIAKELSRRLIQTDSLLR